MDKHIKNKIKQLVERYQMSFLPLRFVNKDGIKSGKVPAINSWSQYCIELPSDEEIDGWRILGDHSGIGICCGVASNLACIDIDTEDQEVQTEIIKQIPPNTPRIIGSPKRGGKYLFRLREYPNDSIVKGSKLQLGEKVNGKAPVEVFLDGSQIAVPPTIHSIFGDQKIVYEWEKPGSSEYPLPDELPVLTDEIIQNIKNVLYKKKINNLDLDLSKNKAEKNGRWAEITSLAGKLARDKVPFEIAIAKLLEYDQRKFPDRPYFIDKSKGCTNPDPMVNAFNLYTNLINKDGNLSHFLSIKSTSVFQPLKQSINLIPMSEMLKKPLEPIEFIVEDLLIESGTSIISAKPKVGKTTLSRYLALRVAKGLDFLGRATKKGSVMIFALEEKESEIHRQFKNMGASINDDIYIHAGGVPAKAEEELYSLIENYKPVLVIIDTLNLFTKVNDLNDYSKVSLALEPFTIIARKSGTHIMFVHHNRKSSSGSTGESGFDDILGSTALMGAIDTAIIMNRDGQLRTIQTRQRYGHDFENTTLNFNPLTSEFSIGDTKSSINLEKIKHQIHLALAANKTLSYQSLRSKLKCKSEDFSKAINDLVDNGEILKEGNGKRGSPTQFSIPTLKAGTEN